MRRIIVIAIVFLSIIHLDVSAQEKYGSTLNLGLGIGGYAGYSRYIGRSQPVFHINYEFDVAESFTLAPFASIYSYSSDYYWGNKNTPYRYYSYRETVIPVGVKGSYYFDNLIDAGSKWDFYIAGSMGFVIVNSKWDAGYYGDKNYYHNGRALFLDIHMGTEYHFNSRVGAFLDISTGMSTIGLAIHAK